eukprot:gene1926-10417_t
MPHTGESCAARCRRVEGCAAFEISGGGNCRLWERNACCVAGRLPDGTAYPASCISTGTSRVCVVQPAGTCRHSRYNRAVRVHVVICAQAQQGVMRWTRLPPAASCSRMRGVPMPVDVPVGDVMECLTACERRAGCGAVAIRPVIVHRDGRTRRQPFGGGELRGAA